ncbi:MAG: hypothetical protein ABR508_07445 [Candidatus Baltobacteraceae bacterium]
MDFRRALIALCFLTSTLPGIALARPQVALHLSAFLIQSSQGRSSQVPLGDKKAQAGDRVRFIIEARNSGSSSALHLTPTDPIPAHMTYVSGSAQDGQSTVQFTVDGKTWAEHPTVHVKTSKRTISKPADPSMYRAIRWVTHVALPAKHTFTYSYEAQVDGLKKGAK